MPSVNFGKHFALRGLEGQVDEDSDKNIRAFGITPYLKKESVEQASKGLEEAFIRSFRGVLAILWVKYITISPWAAVPVF